MSADFPADLVDAYRQRARNRERDWLNPSPDAAWDYKTASRAIRLHPFWRTLADPAAVAEAGRLLREISVLPSEEGGRPVVPYLPLERDPDQSAWHGNLTDPELRVEYAARLDAAGLWDRLPAGLRAQERRQAELTGQDMRFGLDFRDRQFFADGEELLERGIQGELFDELAPSLAEAGLALDVVALSDPYRPPPPGGDDYVLEINGLRCEVWTADDDSRDSDGWYIATVRPLIVINELLEAVGTRERLYMDAAGGNEGCVFLIPAEVRAVLVDPAYGRWSEAGLVLMERDLWRGPK